MHKQEADGVFYSWNLLSTLQVSLIVEVDDFDIEGTGWIKDSALLMIRINQIGISKSLQIHTQEF